MIPLLDSIRTYVTGLSEPVGGRPLPRTGLRCNNRIAGAHLVGGIWGLPGMSRLRTALASGFLEHVDSDLIERQSHLTNCLLVVFVAHMSLIIGFLGFQHYESSHPRMVPDLGVIYEFSLPPPDPTIPLTRSIPPPRPDPGEALTAGRGPAPVPLNELQPAGELQPPRESAGTAAPALPRQAAAQQPHPPHREVVAPPVSVTPTNVIAQAPQFRPADSPVSREAAAVTGGSEHVTGSPIAGPDDVANQMGSDDGTSQIGGDDGANRTGADQGVEKRGGAVSGDGVVKGGEEITKVLAPEMRRATGDISKYRKDLLLRIARKWHPTGRSRTVVILLVIGQPGNLISAKIQESSGSRRTDRQALEAVNATEFAPLPDWYRGESIPFKINMSTMGVWE